MRGVRGYKVFNPDWTCRGFQYEVGKVFEEATTPEVCVKGFHFCKRAVDCFNYYSFNPDNKVAEVIALGDIDEEGNKCSTNKIHILREISWEELLNLVNTGKGNSGHSNSGDWNSGDWNSGNRNNGDGNSGNGNSGLFNSGNRNSGNRNSGNGNSGNGNSGHFNSGNWNRGNFCTGDFNIADYASGCFCTEEHKIRFFDKETDMTLREWRNSKAYYLLSQIPFHPTSPTSWVWSEDMTDGEKAAHPEHEVVGGYLKNQNTHSAFLAWWERLSESERDVIKQIPNFDADKFEQITGIRV